MTDISISFERTVYNSKFFKWNKSKKEFSANISSLGKFAVYRLFPDSKDVGFEIKSNKTGMIEKVYMTDIKTNSKGDIDHWIFLPVRAELKFILRIYNI